MCVCAWHCVSAAQLSNYRTASCFGARRIYQNLCPQGEREGYRAGSGELRALLERDQEGVKAMVEDGCADTCKVLIAGKSLIISTAFVVAALVINMERSHMSDLVKGVFFSVQ